MSGFEAVALPGSVGLVIGVVILQTGYTTALGTALIAVIAEVPYLAGFGGGTLLLRAVQSGRRHSPRNAIDAGPLSDRLSLGSVVATPPFAGAPAD